MRSFRLFQRSAAMLTQQTNPSRLTRQRFFSSSPLPELLSKRPMRLSFRHFLARPRPFSSKPEYNPTNNLGSPGATSSLSLSQRLRKLSREYGWSAFGVYMTLSALDFPFCFLAVRWLGTERIGAWEHAVLQWVRRAIPVQWPEKWGGPPKALEAVEEFGVGTGNDGAAVVGYDHGVKNAEEENSGDNASLWTQLALAYAIHKSFIFMRVPLAAAITPKVVKTLRGWGWNIGKRTPKAERLARKAERAEKAAGKQ